MRLQKKRTSGFARVSSILSLDGLEPLFETEDNQVKWDFNLSRLPYFVSGDKHEDRFRSIVLVETIEREGKIFQSEWRVIQHPTLGLPGGFDRDVWIGILQIVNELTDNGKLPVPEIIELGPFHSFLKRIGKGTSGRDVQRLKESIERLATTGCVTKGSFNCPGSGGYLHLGEAFHLLRSWAFKGEPKTGGGVHETNYVILDPLIRKNLDNFYVSLLRVDYMRDLKGEITKLLYPLLSYRFWHSRQNGRNCWRVRWSELVGYIALKGIDSLKRAKDTLKPALQELKAKQYIDAESGWDGEFYVFYPGLEHAKEHQQKVNAQDRVKLKRKGLQPRQVPTVAVKPVWHGTHNDPNPRETEIGYQVFRLTRGQELNLERLKTLAIDPQEVHDALEKSKNDG